MTSIDYHAMLAGVVAKVSGLGVAVQFEVGKALDGECHDIDSLPLEIAEMYRQVGDGFRLAWTRSDLIAGGFRIPPIRGWPGMISAFRRDLILDDEVAHHRLASSGIDHGYLEAVFEELAELRPLWDFGNGDWLCVALDGQVVIASHDWYDGGGDPVRRVGALLGDFLWQWGMRCFQSPSSLWWLLSPGDWSAECFDGQLRIDRGVAEGWLRA